MSLHPIPPQPLPEARHFDPILREDLAELYRARAARLTQLAEGHELAAFLALAAEITLAQRAALGDAQAPDGPVDAAAIAASGSWSPALDRMLEHLAPRVPDGVRPHLDRLAQLSGAARIEAATALVAGRFDAVDPALHRFSGRRCLLPSQARRGRPGCRRKAMRKPPGARSVAAIRSQAISIPATARACVTCIARFANVSGIWCGQNALAAAMRGRWTI